MRTSMARLLEKALSHWREKREKRNLKLLRAWKINLLNTEMELDKMEVHADGVSVICSSCGGYCGQCGSGMTMERYEKQLEAINNEYHQGMDRLYDRYHPA